MSDGVSAFRVKLSFSSPECPSLEFLPLIEFESRPESTGLESLGEAGWIWEAGKDMKSCDEERKGGVDRRGVWWGGRGFGGS